MKSDQWIVITVLLCIVSFLLAALSESIAVDGVKFVNNLIPPLIGSLTGAFAAHWWHLNRSASEKLQSKLEYINSVSMTLIDSAQILAAYKEVIYIGSIDNQKPIVDNNCPAALVPFVVVEFTGISDELSSVNVTKLTMILPRFNGHLVKQRLHTRLEFDTPMWNEVSADYKTLQCNQKYFV